VNLDSTSTTPDSWTPAAWRTLVAKQQPTYPDPAVVADVVKDLCHRPPLVAAAEIDTLRGKIAQAQRGEVFFLQGGDCAETFAGNTPAGVFRKLDIIDAMARIISDSSAVPTIRVGRIAGQFAKPRTVAEEEIDGQILPTYRGDSINSIEATPAARRPQPQRMLQSYTESARALGFIRQWQSLGPLYEDFYTSHEALLLPYEEALTRWVAVAGKYYNSSAHLLWIGDRTRHLDEAHVAYVRGICNPIAIKVGPSANFDEIATLVRTLNPHNLAGKIILITRFGATLAGDLLPKLIEKIISQGLLVAWFVDPMHGNLRIVAGERKTRAFDDMLQELQISAACHQKLGSIWAGAHLELTGDPVTECIGGRAAIAIQDLTRQYETLCDPRLNADQSLEMAGHIADLVTLNNASPSKNISCQPIVPSLLIDTQQSSI